MLRGHKFGTFTPDCCTGEADTEVNDYTGTLCKYEADMGKVWWLLESCFYLFRLTLHQS